MPLAVSLSQASLAATILIATVGGYKALSPPGHDAALTTKAIPATGDVIRGLSLTNKHAINLALAPLGLLSLHASAIALLYPNIPSRLLGHGAANRLNAGLVTWSAATAIPLALVLCAGIPLRLGPYAALGKNFTFDLAEPDRLTTTGIYHYLQHPSYTGLMLLIVCSLLLPLRVDGVAACWIPPRWYPTVRSLKWILDPLVVSMMVLAIRARVGQEERMLLAEFGDEWKRWHSVTARFIPWVL